MKEDIAKIRSLVGENVEPEQLRYMDCFVHEKLVLFMPQGGACFFALTPLHDHPGYMFILPFNDQTRVKIDQKIIAANPGKILALSPQISHHELSADAPPQYIAIFIDRSFFDKELSCYPAGKDIVFRGEEIATPPGFLSLLKEFMIEAGQKIPGSQSVLHALGIKICHLLIRSALDIAPAPDALSTRVEIGRAIEYMHLNLDRKTSLEDMAKAAHMSSSHFSRVFKEETGVSPSEYLKNIRMQRAKKLLLAGDKSITEVALESGFGSSAYFAERFLREFKITPPNTAKSFRSKIISSRSKDLVVFSGL